MTTTTTPNTPHIPVEQDILDSLALNLQLCQDLLAALQEENTALRKMDTQGLFRLSRQKDTLLAKIHYLDDSLQKSLAEQGKNPSAAGQSPERTRVIGAYKLKIKTMRQEIQAKNMINKRFTEDTLGYLNDAIALITRPAQAENIYRIPGRFQARRQSTPSFISRQV